ncbi:Dabb family protein [Neolewinella agarilytica]|uniref:Dabb family protein n=1 Tax=Neolewinella agarilytica TaxID=478744 RepID=UPI0023539FD9|nr:Dabb family protein [Neolewinella agarilytica]
MKMPVVLIPLLLLPLLCTCDRAREKAAATPEAMSAPDSLLRHVVLFSFKTESGADSVETAFRELAAAIPLVHGYEWGPNVSHEGLDRGFTHSFLLTFLSEADRDAYLDDPAQDKFLEVLLPALDKVTVVDYWARD